MRNSPPAAPKAAPTKDAPLRERPPATSSTRPATTTTAAAMAAAAASSMGGERAASLASAAVAGAVARAAAEAEELQWEPTLGARAAAAEVAQTWWQTRSHVVIELTHPALNAREQAEVEATSDRVAICLVLPALRLGGVGQVSSYEEEPSLRYGIRLRLAAKAR